MHEPIPCPTVGRPLRKMRRSARSSPSIGRIAGRISARNVAKRIRACASCSAAEGQATVSGMSHNRAILTVRSWDGVEEGPIGCHERHVSRLKEQRCIAIAAAMDGYHQAPRGNDPENVINSYGWLSHLQRGGQGLVRRWESWGGAQLKQERYGS